MLKLPNLNALRAFEAAARHESFTHAADELGVTQAAISRHVRNLERELGLILFHRAHKAVSLTKEGTRYAARLTEAFGIMSPVPKDHRNNEPSVKLDIDADLLRLWLMPRLTCDVLDMLGVHIDFHARSDRPRTLTADTALAITWGALDYDGFNRHRFVAPRVFPIASPGLGISDIHGIGQVRLLHDRDETWWRAMFDAADLPFPITSRALTFNRCDLPIEAAREGLGVSVGDDVIAEEYLKSGQLIRLDGPILSSKNYYLLARRPRLSVETKRLMDWLMAQAASFSRWQKCDRIGRSVETAP